MLWLAWLRGGGGDSNELSKITLYSDRDSISFFQQFGVNTDGWTGENKWKPEKSFQVKPHSDLDCPISCVASYACNI